MSGRPSRPGARSIGMRERAQLYGGTVATANRAGAGLRRPCRAADGGSGVTRVIVVDDQELVRTGFAMILDKAGLDVVGQGADGEEGVALAIEHRPDVVLMDVRMPGVDGIEATRRITAAEDSPRVLVLTTFDLDEHVFAAMEAGASGFLLKDVAPRPCTQFASWHVVKRCSRPR